MNYSHYKQASTEYDGREQFKVFQPMRTQKTKSFAYVHVGPESIAALDSYLKERTDKGESLSNTSPLFLGIDGNRLTPKGISLLLARMASKIEDRNGKKISAHSLRKFHTTMLESAMPRSWIAKLQGKKIMDSMGVYSQPEKTEGELTRAYMKSYDRLRIFKEKHELTKVREEVESTKNQMNKFYSIVNQFLSKVSDDPHLEEQLKSFFDQQEK
jgi:hypothetical protein